MRLRDLPRRILRRLLFGKKKKQILRQREDLSSYEIGRWSYGNLEVFAWSKNGRLTIGNFCSFAAGTTIFLGGEHRVDLPTTFPIGVFLGGVERFAHERTKGDVTIGHDVWVGQGATILSGVSIGNGAVVGAGALVTRDVPSYTIVAGNPARAVRKRFDDETIQQFNAIKWWYWSDQKIKDEAQFLLGEDVGEFVRRHRPT